MAIYNLSDIFPIGALQDQLEYKMMNNLAHEIIVALGPDAWSRGPVKLFDKAIASAPGGKFVVTDNTGKIINYFPDKESAVKAALTINMVESAFGKSIKEENGKFVVYDGDKPINTFPDRQSALEAQARIEIGKIFKSVVADWESFEPNVTDTQMMDMYKASGKVNPNGTFKDGFKGCVAHMSSQGKSAESAQKLCAYIGRNAGKIKANDNDADDMKKQLDGALSQLAQLLNDMNKATGSPAVSSSPGASAALKAPSTEIIPAGTGGPLNGGDTYASRGTEPAVVQPTGSAAEKVPTNPGNKGDIKPSSSNGNAVIQPGSGATPSYPGNAGTMVPGNPGAAAVGQPNTGGGKVPAYLEGLAEGGDAWSNDTSPEDTSFNPNASMMHLGGLNVNKRSDGMVDWTIEYPIYKTDLEQRLVGGVVYEPDMIDAQGDSASEFEIQKAAHKFLKDSKTLGVMHKENAGERASIVESYITPAPMRIGNQNVRKGTWIMVAKVHDDALWNDVKNGKITGFSMGGRANEDPMPEDNKE